MIPAIIGGAARKKTTGFSGLEAQSEITNLLDMLYGSYGEGLIATYKLAS
jgi:hypothetical protein